VIIFDDEIVAMGSFNFSASARDNNSENLLIIHNPEIAANFTAEWQGRFNEGRVPVDNDRGC
jgi:phosphatidylserine/phosphatidylglycerophosphate/cardiolipin synthase-like enzyme